MSEYDYGPLRTYEVTWKARPPEMVQGHQVIFESANILRDPAEPRFFIHGMFPGRRWRLVLTGLEADVAGVRDVTDHLAELEAMAAEEADGE